jgi:cyclopropane fatty-acyl-phospholipid synthase-like methyltransferase
MGYYDTERGVEEYVEMAKGYDGAQLIDVLKGYLPAGSAVLEVGMGPGVDLDILARTYAVTGSDYSQVFLDRYRETHPEADLMLLDAVSLKTERRFDGLYSNKVLHHLSPEELRTSLEAQAVLLDTDGVAMHSFWWGEQEEEWMEGLRFVYYTEPELVDAVLGTGLEVARCERYTEMETNDSFFIVLRKLG